VNADHLFHEGGFAATLLPGSPEFRQGNLQAEVFQNDIFSIARSAFHHDNGFFPRLDGVVFYQIEKPRWMYSLAVSLLSSGRL
jgi:hypothetical protein